MVGATTVGTMVGATTVGTMVGATTVGTIGGATTVGTIGGATIVGTIGGATIVGTIGGATTVGTTGGTGNGGIKGIIGAKPVRPIPRKGITGGAVRNGIKPSEGVARVGINPGVGGSIKAGAVPEGVGKVVPKVVLPNQPVKLGIEGAPNQPPKLGIVGMVPRGPKPPQVGVPSPPKVGVAGISAGAVPGMGGAEKYMTGLNAGGMINCACALKEINRPKPINTIQAAVNIKILDIFFINSP